LAIGVDFQHGYWPGARRLLEGLSPYSFTPAQIKASTAFVYPPLTAVAFVPFALIASGTAVVLFTLVCIVCTPLTLWVLNVRDWRIYGLVILWLPICTAWQTANETMVLVLIVALIWRWRARPLAAALLTAAAISLKMFMWPLALWLVATRRWHTSVYTLIWGLILNAGALTVVGFGRIHQFLHTTSLDTRDNWRNGYSVVGAAGRLGLSRSSADILTALLCAILAAAVVYSAAVKQHERQALLLTVMLMLVASPLIWIHYFALLLIPLALERPRVGWLWALPVLLWLCPDASHVVGWQVALTWLVAGTMLVLTIRSADG